MKWIKKKIGNKDLRIILYFILGLTFLSVAVPAFLEFFIWRNQIYSAISNSDWSSFLGSYLGGVIGGSATLLAVWLTSLESKTDRYKEFLIEIINICSSYINEISAIQAKAEEAGGLAYDITELKKDISKIEKNLSSLRAPSEEVKIELDKKLKTKKNNLIEKERKHQEVLESYKMLGSKTRQIALVLDIYLQNIDFAEELLTSIKNLDTAVTEVQNKLIFNADIVDELDLGRLSTENVNKDTKKFANQYRKTYIFS